MEKCNLTQVPCRKAIMDVVQANKDRRSLQHTYELAELFRIACSGNEAFMELSEEDQERFWLITDISSGVPICWMMPSFMTTTVSDMASASS